MELRNCDNAMIPSDTTTKYEVSPFLCLFKNISENILLPNVVQKFIVREHYVNDMNLGGTSSTVTATSGGCGCNMSKNHLRVQDHQSPTLGSSATRQHSITKAKTNSFIVRLRSMST